jgi:hypothetical protein
MEDRQSARPFSIFRNLLFSMFNKEFLIFLFFLLLSGAFWLVMTLNETFEREIKIPVHLENIPKKVVVTSNVDDTLRVTVRDRGYLLFAYLYGQNQRSLHINFNTYNKGNGHGSVQAADLQKLIYQQLFKSSRISSIKPDKFEYLYNYGNSKRVPVRLKGTITPGKSYYLANVAFSPETITIYASQAKLDSLSAILTEQVNLTNVTDTVVQEVMLSKIPGVKCIPSKVTMSIYPDVLTEESVEVPITAVNMPEGKVLRTFPSRVKVVFTTGASQFRSIHPDQFRVEVDYWEIQSHPSDKCTVSLKMAPYGIRNARPDPDKVDYLIENQ